MMLESLRRVKGKLVTLCRRGDGYFIGIHSKKLDRRIIVALNAQHMTSLLSDQLSQLILTYDVSTLGDACFFINLVKKRYFLK